MGHCCGISSDYIYQRLKSTEGKESESHQLMYDLLLPEDELKVVKTEENQEDNNLRRANGR
jgi:hypothetical protein